MWTESRQPFDRDRVMTIRSAGTAAVLLLASRAGCAPPADGGQTDATREEAATDPVADREALSALLDDFLARTDQGSAHDRFWAADRISTSSDGSRRGKPEIMAGFTSGGEAPSEAEEGSTEPGPTYAAEDVEIRLYRSTAVVAFRLVIVPPEGSDEPPSYNWNTGTFVKRDGEWRVVAWQSTRGAE